MLYLSILRVEVSDLSGFSDFHCEFSAWMFRFEPKINFTGDWKLTEYHFEHTYNNYLVGTRKNCVPYFFFIFVSSFKYIIFTYLLNENEKLFRFYKIFRSSLMIQVN